MEPEEKALEWSDKFVSGNKEIDNYHKEIINGVSELYKMCLDTTKYQGQISILVSKIETALIDHMDIEIYYMKKLNIDGYIEHENDHKLYLNKLESYKRHSMPPAVRAILICESARDYMSDHFFKFDLLDIPKINEKLKENNL